MRQRATVPSSPRFFSKNDSWVEHEPEVAESGLRRAAAAALLGRAPVAGNLLVRVVMKFAVEADLGMSFDDYISVRQSRMHNTDALVCMCIAHRVRLNYAFDSMSSCSHEFLPHKKARGGIPSM